MEGGRVGRDQCNLNRFGNPEFNSHDVINCRICILMVENVRYWLFSKYLMSTRMSVGYLSPTSDTPIHCYRARYHAVAKT